MHGTHWPNNYDEMDCHRTIGPPGSEMEHIHTQVGSETGNVVRVGDSGTGEKTGGGDGGGRVEDVAIFIRSDKNGQGQE